MLGCLVSAVSITFFSFNVAAAQITEKDIAAAQQKWADCIVQIGKTATEKGDYKAVAEKCVTELYAYDSGPVLFKPTKAAEKQFRATKKEALSYFITGEVPEDHGFALQPWSNVRFEPAGTIIDSDSAITMGNYYFTDAKTGKEVKVEYTFGYKQGKDGKLLINLHHSSLPYTPSH